MTGTIYYLSSVNMRQKTWLILIAVAVVALFSVGLLMFTTSASEGVGVKLPPNSTFVAVCQLQFVNGGLMLAGPCVSGNLTVVEFRAVGDELALNFTLYGRGGMYKRRSEWPRFMIPLEKEPAYRNLDERLRVNASIYLVDWGVQGAGGGYSLGGSPYMTYSLMMEHTALVVDNKTLIVVVTFRAWKLNQQIRGSVSEQVEQHNRQDQESLHQAHLRDVEEALKEFEVNNGFLTPFLSIWLFPGNFLSHVSSTPGLFSVIPGVLNVANLYNKYCRLTA